MHGAHTDGPIEPLGVSAPLARAWALERCVHDANGERCDAYHGFWQTMRLMHLGATLGGHPHAYLQAFARWANQPRRHPGPRRVLISGCADYAMLAHLWHATQAVAATLDVTVLDICPTPLALNQWYAQRVGGAVQTVCCDIQAHRPSEAYDLIVTSSFLGYFHPQQRPALFQAYRRMLRSGGELVFSNRLRTAPEHIQVGFTPVQAQQFARAVERLSADLPATAALDAHLAHAMALAFAHYNRNYPVSSVQTILELAHAGAMHVVHCDVLQSTPMRPDVSGPTLGDGSNYVFVVLTV